MPLIKKNTVEEGFVALISILVVSAIGVLIIISLSSSSISSSKMTVSTEDSMGALFFANTCIEEALLKIREENFIGSGNISFGKGNCYYNIESNTGESRTITTEGEVGFAKRKLKVIISTINPKIVILSWKEVVNY